MTALVCATNGPLQRQVIVPDEVVQSMPPGAETPPAVNPAGSASVTTAFETSDGPPFVAVSV